MLELQFENEHAVYSMNLDENNYFLHYINL